MGNEAIIPRVEHGRVEEAIDIYAPEVLSNSYLTGTPPNGISMKAWISFGGLRPAVTRLRSMIFSAYTSRQPALGGYFLRTAAGKQTWRGL
jgi:hypothetical protein